MKASPVELDSLRQWLVQLLCRELRLEPSAIRTDRPLTEYGLDSMAALMVAGELEDRYRIELPATLLWDHPSIDGLAACLQQLVGESEASACESA